MGELDAQYMIGDKAKDAHATTKAQAMLLAMQASAKASELDKQYKIQETALNKGNQAWSKIMEVDQKYGVKAKAGEWLFKGIDAAKAAAAKAQGGPQGGDGTVVEGREGQKAGQCDACAVM